MPKLPFRPALAAFLLLALAACDASDSVRPEPGYRAEVSGAFARSVQGPAAVDSLSGIGVVGDLGLGMHGMTITALRLGEEGGDDTFYVIGTTSGPLTPGTYTIRGAAPSEMERERTRFAVLYRYDGGRMAGGGVAASTSGMLTVTSVDDGEIAGSFEFGARILDRDVKAAPGEPDLAVEGAFRVETRDLPARPRD